MKTKPTLAVVVVLAGCSGAPALPPSFESARVVAHTEAQCAFGPRVPGSAARDSAAAYISGVLRAHGVSVELQSFEIEDPYTGEPLGLINVIGRFAPGKKKRVTLASHYDSRPWADQEALDSLRTLPVPGAIDGACSSGILLEMARLAAAAPPGVGVDFVFFDGEDYGQPDALEKYCLGSRHYVSMLEGDRPETVILLDMVGGRGTVVAREGYSRTNSAELCDDIFARAARLGLSYFRDVGAGAVYDDHVPFIQAGIDAVDIFGFDYRAWHTLADTPDQVDPALVDQVGTLLVDFIWAR